MKICYMHISCDLLWEPVWCGRVPPRQQEGVASFIPSLSIYIVPFMSSSLAVQIDASKMGLGHALIQVSVPVAFASEALSGIEQHYINIEYGFLPIVLGVSCFKHTYLDSNSLWKLITNYLKLLSCKALPRQLYICSRCYTFKAMTRPLKQMKHWNVGTWCAEPLFKGNRLHWMLPLSTQELLIIKRWNSSMLSGQIHCSVHSLIWSLMADQKGYTQTIVHNL